jgi:transcription elongation factor Elf1
MSALQQLRKFPCPVCTEPREVRLTKKSKPYVTCDLCGVQLFIRGRVGIERFVVLVERSTNDGVLARFNEMERRYRRTCGRCGHRFWVEPRLLKTSLFDGSLKGFRCPRRGCEAIVPWEFES